MIYVREFLKILRHKWFVLLAGLRVGGIPIWRLLVHDLSKFSRLEFGAYARNFQLKGEKAEKAGLDFAYAWLHHESHNPHHWGYWIPRSGKYAQRPLPMPESYVREMVADWMGASRAYGKSWDIGPWLKTRLLGFDLHPETRARVYRVLAEQGYGDLIRSLKSA